MTASERRQEIMNILVSRRRSTVSGLAIELDVSKRTILRDVLELSLQYPIETEPGRYGGVKLADWFRPDRRVLAREQAEALRKAAQVLEGEDRQAILSILTQFSV